MIRGVIFDLGGTLLHFEGDWHDVLQRGRAALAAHLKSAAPRGLDFLDFIDFDEVAFATRYGEVAHEFYFERQHDWAEYTAAHIVRLCLAEMGITDVSDTLVDEGLVSMFGPSEELWRSFDDAASTLERLREAGYRLGIISNASDDANVQRLVDLGGLRQYFDPIIVSAAVGVRKPSPRIFEIVLDRWQLPPKQVAMIGDTLGADVLGAQLSGMRSVWAMMDADNPANAGHRGQIVPDATISTLGELPDMLTRWNGSRGEPPARPYDAPGLQ